MQSGRHDEVLANVNVFVELHELAVEIVLKPVSHLLTELLKSGLAVLMLRATNFQITLQYSVDFSPAQSVDQHVVFE